MTEITISDGIIELVSPITLDWAPILARLANDKSVYDNIGAHAFPYPYRQEDAETFITKNRFDGSRPFAIDFRIMSGRDMVGVIGISQINYDDRNAHIGYWIGAMHRGKGAATRATNLIVGYCRNEMKLHRLYTSVMSTNPASARVLEKAGFLLEGVRKEHFLFYDRYVDMLMLGIILD